MPDLDPIVSSFPVPPVIKDEPTGRFRRPVISPDADPDADDKDKEEPEANPEANKPRKPADDGHIDEYA